MDGLVAWQMCLFFIAFLVVLFVIQRTLAWRTLPNLPGPSPSLILGNIGDVMKAKQPLSMVLSTWTAKYGLVYKIYRLGELFVIIADPELLKLIAVTNSQPKPVLGSYKILGPALLTFPDEDQHGPRKNAILPFFHLNSLQTMLPIAVDAIIRASHHLAARSGPVNIAHMMGALTLDVMGKAAFAVDFGTIESPNGTLAQAVTDFLSYVAKLSQMPWYFLNLSARRKYLKAKALIEQLAIDVLNKRQQHLGTSRAEEGRRLDILDLLLKARNADGTSLSMQQMVTEFVVFVIAGHETTANSLSFAFLELLQHPESLVRIRHEVEALVQPQQRPPDMSEAQYLTEQFLKISIEDTRSSLRYTQAVLMETLRLHCVVPGAARIAKQDIPYKDYVIPKGTVLYLAFLSVGRCSELWPDPLRFDPERFLSGAKDPFASLPFSAGPRVCIGKEFALIEAKVTLALFVYLFDMSLDTSHPHGEIVQALTLRPKEGVMVTCRARMPLPALPTSLDTL